MILGELFERFVKDAPITVMTRILLEYVFTPGPIDEMFQRMAQEQYSKVLLFSTCVDIMSLVVCGIFDSPHAVYQNKKHLFPVCLKCFYEKLQGIELPVMRQLVVDTAQRCATVLRELGGTLPELLPGYRVKILDGNCLAGSDHRIKELRDLASAPLPGKTLAVLDPQLGLIVDVFPCEDGHAQERSLLGAVLETVVAGELWIEDRNFCTCGWLGGVARRQAYFLVREHLNLPWVAGSELRLVGRTATGEVWEQMVEMEVKEEQDQEALGQVLCLQRLVIKLDEPTRDGETEVALLTNVWGVNYLTLADLYLKRWSIETAFQVLTQALKCEHPSLGYPKAALFAFCVAVVSYNAFAVVKAALRAVHGCDKVEKEVSVYHMTEDVSKTYRGMMVAIVPEEWEKFRYMSPQEIANILRNLAQQADLGKYKKAPTKEKKPKIGRKFDPQKPHVSTAKVLAERHR